MKKFSVKDFISFNSPCFGCNELISFFIMADPVPEESHYIATAYLKPRIEKTHHVIDLHIGWNDSLRLTIDHKTNGYDTNNPRALRKYLSQRQMGLRCECLKCLTS